MPMPPNFRGMPPQAQGMPQRPVAPMGGGGRPAMPMQGAPMQAMGGRPPMPAMPQAPAGGIAGLGQRPPMPTQAAGARPFKKGGPVSETSAKYKRMDKKHGLKEGSRKEEKMDAAGYKKGGCVKKYKTGGMVKGKNARRARKGC